MDFAFKGLKGFAADAATALNRAVQVSINETSPDFHNPNELPVLI